VYGVDAGVASRFDYQPSAAVKDVKVRVNLVCGGNPMDYVWLVITVRTLDCDI
jgi:hypothetical protein